MPMQSNKVLLLGILLHIICYQALEKHEFNITFQKMTQLSQRQVFSNAVFSST